MGSSICVQGPPPSAYHNKNTGRSNGSIKPLGRPQLAWYDYIGEMQVYTALRRPTEVESGATGHQVTICHISKAANKYTPFPGHSPEDSHPVDHFVCDNCDTDLPEIYVGDGITGN